MGGWLTRFLTRGVVARGETKDEGKLWVEGLEVGWLRGSAPSACPSFLGPCQARPYLLGLLPSAPTPFPSLPWRTLPAQTLGSGRGWFSALGQPQPGTRPQTGLGQRLPVMTA